MRSLAVADVNDTSFQVLLAEDDLNEIGAIASQLAHAPEAKSKPITQQSLKSHDGMEVIPILEG